MGSCCVRRLLDVNGRVNPISSGAFDFGPVSSALEPDYLMQLWLDRATVRHALFNEYGADFRDFWLWILGLV